MSEKSKPLLFTQAFGIDKTETDLEFFDSNLLNDTKAFIDPFLIKKSPVQEERALFARFGDYFRNAYDMSMTTQLSVSQLDNLRDYLDIPEPKVIALGYTEASHAGSGPGESFAQRLLEFFLENAARKFLRETEVFQDREFNPWTLEIFMDGLGPDGISDISASLIMDYLIRFTKEQCDALGIKTKQLPLETDGYDFDAKEWRGGQYYDLPENPLQPGVPVILVPKRFLRAFDSDGESIQSAVKGILRNDKRLSKKFSTLLARKVDEISIGEVRSLFLEEHSVFKRYLEHMQRDLSVPYDFIQDARHLLALKSFKGMFDSVDRTEKINDCDALLKLVNRFLSMVSDHYSRTDGWKRAWTDDRKREAKEEDIGRDIRAMGYTFFDAYPDVTFDPQVNGGAGPVDYKISRLDCRITIEIKRLGNDARAGTPPLPAYIHGIQRQLPAYTYVAKAKHAIYVTIQHYSESNSPKHHDDDRVKEIENLRPIVEAEMKAEQENFQSLSYVNILAIPRPSASKL